MKPILSPFSSKILETSADSCLLRIRDLVKEEGGSNESGSGLEHLEYRCHKRMHKIGLNTLDSYWEMLTTLPGGQHPFFRTRTCLNSTSSATSYFPELSRVRRRPGWRTFGSGLWSVAPERIPIRSA